MASKTRTQRVRLCAAFGLLALTAVAALFLATALTASGSHPGRIAKASGGAFSNRAAKAVQFPIYFEKNQGQVNRQARFLARTAGNSLFLTDNAAVFTLIGGDLLRTKLPDGFGGVPQVTGKLIQSNVAIRLLDANPHPVIGGEEPLRARANYLIGSDPRKWHRDIPTFERVRYHEIYPGIDLVFYGTPGALEYDLIAQPGADTSKIRFAIDGGDKTTIDGNGSLTIPTAAGTITMVRPNVYQTNPDGSRSRVDASFRIGNGDAALRPGAKPEVTIALGSYDRSRSIVIDPQLVYSTYYGGGASSTGPISLEQFQFVLLGATLSVADLAFDVFAKSGNEAYITGVAFSNDLPNAMGSETGANAPPKQNPNAFVARFDPTKGGTASLIWATYIGGSGDTNGADAGHGNGDLAFGLAVDGNSEATIVGQTYSTDFPGTSSCGAWGQTNNQKNTATNVGFISELNAAGDGIVYSCYIPGSDNATAARVRLANSCSTNCATYVVGSTQSTAAKGFPVTANAFQSDLKATNSKSNAFILVVSGNGKTENYCSYYGGSGNGTNADSGLGIAVNSTGKPVITGATFSSDLSLSSTPLQNSYKGGTNSTSNAFVAEFDPTKSGAASLLYATYLGGSGAVTTIPFVGTFALGDGGTGIDFGNSGATFVLTGFTASTDFFPTTPTAPAFQSSNPDNTASGAPATAAFVAKINPTLAAASQLDYGTYFGGHGHNVSGILGTGDAATDISFDQTNGIAYLVGGTTSSDTSWLSSNACQTTNNSSGITISGQTIPLTAFAAAIDITQSNPAAQLVFNRYLGGSGKADVGTGLDTAQVPPGAGHRSMLTSGLTYATDFPVTATAFQSTNHTGANASTNAFLAVIDPTSQNCSTSGIPTATATATATRTATATKTATP